ncbi:fimbria/pilus periplasmic chaperone [Providencia sp. Je.9.19]|uniref:fimbria/pilus periplasmic chaperone n=1 Tax=unclassified Providencia TaxID=2633465 RepID=UPI003DA824A7
MNLTIIQRTAIALSGVLISHFSLAGVTMDRTRVIFEGDKKSITLNINNNSQELPYLAQGWLENAEGQKVNTPLVVLPPVQRLEAGSSSQVKIEALSAVGTLPQDRESLFYFNLREIPPKSDKPNVLQLALQTRVKLFYRPKAIIPAENSEPAIEKLTLDKTGSQAVVKNPTPYYVTIVNVFSANLKTDDSNFEPVMVAPFGQANLGMSNAQLGNSPTLITINDYGGRPELTFSCQGTSCQVNGLKP